MKARKLDLTPIFVDVPGCAERQVYPLVDNLVEFLFGPDLHNRGRALLEANALAQKILAADGYILLDEKEHAQVVRAAESFQGLRRVDVPAIERFLNIPEVEVEEKPVEEKPDVHNDR